MRLKVFALLALVMLAVFPALAQESTTNTVSFNDVGFSFDSSLATSVNVVSFPGDPTDLEQPGGPEVRHTEFILYAGQTAPPSALEGVLTVRAYRTADFTGYEFPAQQLTALQNLLASRPDLTTFTMAAETTPETSLPFMPVFPAAQVIRARAQYVDTQALQGVSYITVYRQDVAPFVANEFLYTFQGLSTDGTYYISVIVPVVAADFPAEIPADFDPEAFTAGLNDYLAQSVNTLNVAAPESFTPALPIVDTLVQSISLGGLPTAEPTPLVATLTPAAPQGTPGTAGDLDIAVWTLVSYGPLEAPVAALPEAPITIQFAPDGVSGSAGCNSYSGSFQFENNTIRFDSIVSTLIACAEPVMTQETAFLDALNTATTFELTPDGQLRISYEGGVLVFNPAP